jgi:hypothetical protein
MAKYYTDSTEKKNVYHNNTNCSEYKKIEAKNLVVSETQPVGRSLCEICAKL